MPTLPYDPLREFVPANRERIYAELRERTPVYWSSVLNAWILTRYADVSAILRHPDALALDFMPFLESLCRRGKLDLSHLLRAWSSISFFTRPPRHDAIRRLLAQALAGTRRPDLHELLERRADLLLDCGERDGSIDLAGGYGKALALFVIGSFLGIPEDDLPELSELAFNFLAVFERRVPSVSVLVKLDKRAAALMDYFARLINLRRQNPAEDGISLIVRLADEQLGCSNEELAGYCAFFFTAAEETTSAAISGAALLLLQRPALRAQLSRDDPSRIPHAVRELLRLVSPVQYAVRQFSADIRVSDQLIREGEPIMLMLGAANRDPAVFPNPDEPDLDRPGPESMVFAPGPYRCIGAQLATFEVEVAVRKLLARPRIRLSPDAPVWADRMNFASLKRLKACFDDKDQ
jgi:pimeloyl-[acyl-carrier protein] synthase